MNYVTSVWYILIVKHITQNRRQTKSKTQQTDAKNVVVERLNDWF